MNKKTKLIIGIVLISGIILITSLGVTNLVGEEPPEQEGDDPGNSKGPGIFTSLPTDEIEFAEGLNLDINTLSCINR